MNGEGSIQGNPEDKAEEEGGEENMFKAVYDDDEVIRMQEEIRLEEQKKLAEMEAKKPTQRKEKGKEKDETAQLSLAELKRHLELLQCKIISI